MVSHKTADEKAVARAGLEKEMDEAASFVRELRLAPFSAHRAGIFLHRWTFSTISRIILFVDIELSHIPSVFLTSMLGLALFPLACYFFFLATLHFQKRPTVLTGRQDFMLLACALFGLLTLGPGRLLIPLYLLAFWHLASWLIWAAFYFSAAFLLTHFFWRRRLIIYHCSASILIPILIERTRQADSEARFDGNVLTLPELGVQCSVNETPGNVLILQDTDGQRNPLRWRLGQEAVTAFCRRIEVPVSRSAWFWGLLGVACLAVAAVIVVAEAPELLESFADSWLGGTQP